MASIPAPIFRKLLLDGTNSDSRITCKGVEFRGHKLILGSASDFFRVTSAQEGFQENATGVVDLPEDEPEIVARALIFIYTAEYSSTASADVSKLLGESLIDSTETEEATGTGELTTTGEPTETGARPELSNDKHPADSAESPKQSPTDDRRDRLRISTLTYQIADKFGLRELQLKTFEDFREIFHTYEHSVGGLEEVVTRVYDCTSPDDQHLRLFVTRECVEAFDSVEKDKDMLSAIKTNEPVAWGLARPKQEHINEVERKLKIAEDALVEKGTTLEDLQARFNTLQTSHNNANYYYNQTTKLLDKAKADKMTTEAAIAKFCPHCGEGKLVLAQSLYDRYNNKKEGEVSTNCMACEKKWIFKAA
ncbi:uncharacterized protein AB675_1833 [Cyphellophora attinorum]|uniref:BTB domain-containing protein n=1 Tax=Cyphellophora attinorum TaxID=1664694 RepID=A0A0N1H7U0_9EURO|nr:uncharacterized protein AB675_1833 [Phialophora attinorum]KPI42697.1 hypothetical protein AB675_1833 [Phialophora attinorum]